MSSLPTTQIDTYRRIKADLVELQGLYEAADRRVLAQLEHNAASLQLALATGIALFALLVLVGTVIALRRAGRLLAERSRRADAARLTTFDGQLRRALELVHTDAGAFRVAERATREVLPNADVSVLVADSSRARLTPFAEAPACGVTTPGACPALRTGSSAQFPDSGALDACPVLAANVEVPTSATCVPVAITGRG